MQAISVILASLFPLLIGDGTGHQVMQRLAAPMVGGTVTAPLLSLFVLPAIYKLLGPKRLAPAVHEQPELERGVGMAPVVSS